MAGTVHESGTTFISCTLLGCLNVVPKTILIKKIIALYFLFLSLNRCRCTLTLIVIHDIPHDFGRSGRQPGLCRDHLVNGGLHKIGGKHRIKACSDNMETQETLSDNFTQKGKFCHSLTHMLFQT